MCLNPLGMLLAESTDPYRLGVPMRGATPSRESLGVRMYS